MKCYSNKNTFLIKGTIVVFMLIMIVEMIIFSSSKIDAIVSKNILFVSSYHAGFDTLPEQIRGIQSALTEKNVALDIEFMDTKRYPTQENYAHFLASLQYKMDQGLNYDVILIGDDNGLQFFMDHPELYPNSPKVFFCINDFERAALADSLNNVTGIVEAISIKDNMDLAKALFPNATEFVAIVDNSQTGIGDMKSFMAMESDFPEMKFSVINSSTMTFDEVGKRLKTLSDNQILFYLSMFEDVNGQVISIADAVKIIVGHSTVPAFRMSIGGVEDGLLGGNMVSYFEQGRLAAEIALSIIDGTPIDSIKMIDQSPNKYFINYEVMKTYDLDFSKLPPNTILINKPVTFIEQNKKVLIPMSIAIFILVIILIIILYDNRRQRALRVEIQNNRDELSALYEEITATEEELRDQYERLMESKAALEDSELRYKELAFKDLLTGLGNRIALVEFLENHIQQMSLSGTQAEGTIYYIDIDNFKYINDSIGHEFGDEVLRKIGSRLQSYIQQDDYIARLGGDEFVVVKNGLQKESESWEEARHLIRLIERPIQVGPRELTLSASIGIVKYPNNGVQGIDLLKKGDIALYKAKDRGRGQAIHYIDTMETDVKHLMEMKDNINAAVEQDEFILYYQPQFNASSMSIEGMEGLIRWNSPENGLVFPDRFISIAERLGLIHKIGKVVQREAMRFIQKLEQSSNIRISLNVSASEMTDPEFEESLLTTMEYFKVDPKRIALEITESVLVYNVEATIKLLERLREKGFEVHLDDFGTGYSSLTYLIRLPFDVIKIDRSFVKDMATSSEHQKLIRSIVDLIHNLGKRIIAEGVETREQYELLRDMGCDVIQGYYFSKPIQDHEALMLLQKQY